MDLQEIAHEVEELEPRLERLKALYEQYFMGLEKLEPQTLRRDIDRKFWQLRKMRIQNTALRFRLQMLIQRYNTYQQYWARIMREMERGTYRRDILRAAERVGQKEALTIVGRRRAQIFKRLADEQTRRKERAQAATALADEQAAALAEAAAGTGSAASFEDPPTAEWIPQRGEALDDETDAPTLPPPTGPEAAAIGRTRATAEDEDEIPTMPPPSAEAAVLAAAGAAAALRPAGLPTASDAIPPSERFTDPLPPAAGGPLVPSAPPPSSVRPPLSSPLPPPSMPPSSRRPPASGRPPGESPLPPPSSSAAPAGRKARPSLSPRPDPRPARPAAAGAGDDSMRQLYDDYVAAKRRGNEPTGGLTFDKLERSLREQTERLRQKHGNKHIEFEVVTIGGRALIRPVIK